MKIVIAQIYKRGVKSDERIVLKVMNDTNLTYYAVFDTVYTSPQALSAGNGIKHTYWFGPKPVKAGDQVELLTKDGTPSETKREDGSTVYFYYWGQKGVLWDKTGNCAVLFEISSWQTSTYE